MIDTAYRYLFTGALIVLSLCIIASLIRTIRGPRLADRIMGVNLTGSFAIMAIAILSKLLGEDWLMDVALIYGMISFLAVVVLTKAFITVHFERQRREAAAMAEEDAAGEENA